MNKRITIALAGNPNSGKTTIFNNITGARQHVGNYPGVTIDKKEGTFTREDREITVVDLPGTYSLTAYSEEERVARSFIIDEHPDVIIDIVDSSNLERNLYLAIQLMELNVPLVLVFNMCDVAEKRGIVFDIPKLSSLLGIPIVKAIGSKNQGTEEIINKAIETAAETAESATAEKLWYGKELEEEIRKIRSILEQSSEDIETHLKKWFAIKLLEDDDKARDRIRISEELKLQIEASSHHLKTVFSDSPEIIFADKRYGFISGVCTETVRITVERRHDISDRIDLFFLNKALGLPIFLIFMYLVFQITFTAGAYPMVWLEMFFSWAARFVGNFWDPGPDTILRSLLVDGIIGGVGGVISFIPNLFLLFAAISILEDSGYMARAAFIMDRLMHRIGLHGKSFIPMLLGFGCSVPAIMATRTIENKEDRITTMLVVPLMSCGARLPIYALLIPAFFAENIRGTILWIIYFTGVLLAILSAKILKKTILKGEASPFIMELPPYRVPTLKGVLIHTWERGREYVKKAGTVILGFSILLWAMTSFPRKTEFSKDYENLIESARNREAVSAVSALKEEQTGEKIAYTISGRIGRLLEPVIRPTMGFDWRIGTAMIGSLAAKEIFVSQLGIVFSVGEASDEESSGALRKRLRQEYPPLTAFCIMLFMLISTPCLATIAVTRKESGTWKWALFQLGALTLMAFSITTAVFQFGRLFGIGI